ncbi:hypothetical protein Tco_0765026 [Tanacetum coccineum]
MIVGARTRIGTKTLPSHPGHEAEIDDMPLRLLALREQQGKKLQARQPGPKARIPITRRLLGITDMVPTFKLQKGLKANGRFKHRGLKRDKTVFPMISVVAIVENQVKFSHLHSVRCCFDLVEWSDKNLRSRGICNDLGSKLQEKDDGQKVDKHITDFLTTIYGKRKKNKRNVKSARPKTLDETIELANDLMDHQNSAPKRGKGSLNNKRRAYGFITTQKQPLGPPTATLQKGRMVRQSLQTWGRRKEALWGNPCPSQTSGHLPPTTMARHPEGGHKCNKIGALLLATAGIQVTQMLLTLRRAMGQPPKETVVLIGNAEKKGNAPGNPDANVVTRAKIESNSRIGHLPKTTNGEITRQFLGLAGYYRRFIEGFSKIAKSMTKLTQKGVKFDWGEKEEDAFQLIKQKLCSAPILALPEGSEDFWYIVDAASIKRPPLIVTVLVDTCRSPICMADMVWGSPTDWPGINTRNNGEDRPDQAKGCKAAQIDKRVTLYRKRKPMEFEFFNETVLCTKDSSPWKGVVRFGKRGKLNPRYVGPFKVLAKVRKVAYRRNFLKS